ncbi:MAG: tyrosine-type recombinase/integrase [Flavobacteriaceae bacterium]
MNPIIRLHKEYCNYKQAIKGCSKATISKEYHTVNPFIRFFKLNSVEDLQKLEKKDVLNYIIEKKQRKHWSARTIRNTLQGLKNFFEFCVENKILKENPAKGIEKPKMPNDLPRLIKKDDALKILEWLYFTPFRYKWERERAKAITAIFIFTGIRRSELLNIKNSDMNFKEKILRINSGKGNKDRLIPMNDKLIEILQEYLESDLKLEATSEYFFVKLDGERQMGDGTIRTLFKRFKTELGIAVTPHKLRHTFATLLIKNGCPVPALSKMMGHSKIEVTMKYTWLDVDDLRHEMGKHPFGYANDLPHNHYLSNQRQNYF